MSDFKPNQLLELFAMHAAPFDEATPGYAERLLGRPMPNALQDVEGHLAFWAEFDARVKFVKAKAMLDQRNAIRGAA